MRATFDLDLVIDSIEAITPTIRTLSLRRVDGGPLPSHPPGSHLLLACGAVGNAYSLNGSGRLPERYAISVLLRPDGQGGSRWMHGLAVGQRLRANSPRSAFPPVANARAHLMIAGGIGITPFLSHLEAARDLGRRVELLYGVGGDRPAPFQQRLEELTDGQVEIVRGRDAVRARRDALLRRQPMGTHLYVCGPRGLIDETLRKAHEFGWPSARCHAERFGGFALDEGEPFVVRLRRSERTIKIPSGVSLLEALEAEGLTWPSMCREGVCGECRMEGVQGAIRHRDLVLSPAERAEGGCLMPCVSRADGVLIVDL